MEHVDMKPKNDALSFQRLVYDASVDEVILVNVDDQRRSPATEIEQALDAVRFCQTVDDLELDENTSAIKEIVSSANVNEDSSSVLGYLDLPPRSASRLMKEFFDLSNNKVYFARQYVDQESDNIPKWIENIKQYFRPTPKRVKRPHKTTD
jgi:hypothetical protein